MTTVTLDDKKPHAFWDNTLPPRLRIQPGDTVIFETHESCEQVTPEWSDEDISHMDGDLIHALTGPVYVEGAEPGDVLVIEIIDLKHKNWGWNAVIPSFGLLADEFSEPYIHHYRLVGDYCEFRPNIWIPFEPFCGIMGVAPQEPGRLDTIPPRENGGNVVLEATSSLDAGDVRIVTCNNHQ